MQSKRASGFFADGASQGEMAGSVRPWEGVGKAWGRRGEGVGNVRSGGLRGRARVRERAVETRETDARGNLRNRRAGEKRETDGRGSGETGKREGGVGCIGSSKTFGSGEANLPHENRFRSSERYWMASRTWFGVRDSLPSRSARVRATLRIRSWARAEKFRVTMACSR